MEESSTGQTRDGGLFAAFKRGLATEAERMVEARAALDEKYSGSYDLDLKSVHFDGDIVRVRASATVFSPFGETKLRVAVTEPDGGLAPHGETEVLVRRAVRRALLETRDAAAGVLAAIEIDGDENVLSEGADEDEGLREGFLVGRGGLFVGGNPLAGLVSCSDLEATPSVAELTRRKAHAEALIAQCKAAELARDDSIKLSSAEYDELISAKHSGEKATERLAAIEKQFPKPFGLFLKSGTVKFRATQEVYDQIDAALPAEAFWRLASDAPKTASDEVTDLEAETAGFIVGTDIQPSVDGATTYTVRCGDASMTVTGSASGVASLVKLAYGGFEYGMSA